MAKRNTTLNYGYFKNIYEYYNNNNALAYNYST